MPPQAGFFSKFVFERLPLYNNYLVTAANMAIPISVFPIFHVGGICYLFNCCCCFFFFIPNSLFRPKDKLSQTKQKRQNIMEKYIYSYVKKKHNRQLYKLLLFKQNNNDKKKTRHILFLLNCNPGRQKKILKFYTVGENLLGRHTNKNTTAII